MPRLCDRQSGNIKAPYTYTCVLALASSIGFVTLAFANPGAESRLATMHDASVQTLCHLDVLLPGFSAQS